MTLSDPFAAVLGVLRVVFLYAAVALAVVCLVDWLVRTRRISPFSGVARFFRKSVDPLMAPLERRIVRAGGQPASAPWWALVAVVVVGIIVLSVLGAVRGIVYTVIGYASQGSQGMLFLLVWGAFQLLQFAILIRVLASWIPNLSPYSPWVRWAFVISEPVLRPLRAIIPTLGMIDITPIVAYFVLGWLEGAVLNLLFGGGVG